MKCSCFMEDRWRMVRHIFDTLKIRFKCVMLITSVKLVWGSLVAKSKCN